MGKPPWDKSDDPCQIKGLYAEQTQSNIATSLVIMGRVDGKLYREYHMSMVLLSLNSFEQIAFQWFNQEQPGMTRIIWNTHLEAE